ncbi:ATP-binding protein [Streptomyces sp. KR55]|uniref:ATP-binding protein n=1 Tax=Streptomyces sp. KR55 TaxID=3457425 RepID=UPI003FCF5392
MSTTILIETRRPPAAPLTAQWTAPQPIVSRDRTMSPTVPLGTRPTAGHEAVLALPAEVRWVPVARRCVAAVLAQWRFPSADRESAELVVSELAANAAEHGRHDMTVRLSLYAGVLRISVTDSGAPARPRPAQDADPDEHGRGLAIVGLLAVKVRVHQGPLGRRVDVDLHATATEP